MAQGEPTGSSARRLGAAGIVVDGRYRLEHMLGAGGFGEVWAAVQEVEGSQVRPVALKLLDAPASVSPGATPVAGRRTAADSLASGSSAGGHSWLDEVRAVRDVRCDAIATIFDVGISREPRLAFIAMELLEGSTLDDRLARGPIYWRRALSIARDVASALVACHEVDVSHCDLKPQNVFLAGDGRVCVLDFGVASLGPDGGGARTAARRGSEPEPEAFDMGATGAVALDDMPDAVVPGGAEFHIFGTPGYIPPESFRGDPMGPAADVFALGVVLYRMISGRLPHRIETAGTLTPAESAQRYQAALNTATIGGDFVPLEDVIAGVPEGVRALVARLLEADPDRRPVADLVAAIDEVIHRPYGIPDPPYVGLAAFDARRAGYIAGRDGDIDEVTEKLRDSRAVVLAGPSGCGKSSLAIAGVAHRVDEELLLGCDGWRLVTLRPSQGADALRVLEGAIPLPSHDGTGTVVIVDQLEEVVRLEDAARIAFCTGLATLVEGTAPVEVCGRIHAAGAPVRVIATCRDDLFGRVASLPELRRFPERNLFTVRGVEPNAMAQIVEGPARAAGYRLEGGADVVAEAVRIVAGDSGALPLVQFALTRWWEGRDSERKVLPRSVWEDIGGIEGALAEAAQALYDGFDDGEREQMRALLIAMFRPDGTRVRVEERVVVTNEHGRRVLARLIERRLVTRYSPADGAATLEVVHEALGHRWPLLHQWLEETRSERELIADVHYDAERWRAGGEPSDLLWRGARLEAALRVHDRLGQHARFIDASREAEGKQTWRRRGSRGLLAIASIVAAIMVLTYVGSNRERRRARDAQTAAEVERAKAETARGEAETALERNIELRNQAEAASAKAIAEQARAEEEKAKALEARAQAQEEAAKNAELRAKAEGAEAEAQRAMRQAQTEKAEADRQRELNRLAAETAEKQRREAEAQKKYAETAQRLHEMARKRMERIETQYEQLRKEHKALQQQLKARP